MLCHSTPLFLSSLSKRQTGVCLYILWAMNFNYTMYTMVNRKSNLVRLRYSLNTFGRYFDEDFDKTFKVKYPILTLICYVHAVCFFHLAINSLLYSYCINFRFYKSHELDMQDTLFPQCLFPQGIGELSVKPVVVRGCSGGSLTIDYRSMLSKGWYGG